MYLFKIGSFIYYNGAYTNCIHTGINIHIPIESQITSEVLEYCLSCNPDLDLSIEVQDQWLSLKEYDYTALMRVKERPIVKTLDELKQINASKILFTGNLEMISFQEKFKQKLNILSTDNGSLIQLSSPTASKEKTLEMLCKAMNIPLEGVMVFGDDVNDIGLFQSCGWAVAMGNAIEELKQIAAEITESNDHDGVALVLERLCS
nr:HAD hydrolase family protein [Paenibacillus pasadenensis]